MTHVFKASLLLTIFFGINKIVALVRQTLIAKEFGFSSEIDAFNVANNLPDLVFSLFSGGALALAFIPVFSEYIASYGKVSSWKLFSKTANILFVVTLVISAIFAIFAEPLVSSQFGISPGFSPAQQSLVAELMRINLIALIIFSISGLIMASLQAHKHFFLTAIAPILYNVGLIIGAIILAPTGGFQVGSITLPTFGMGIHGLVYGTVLGALLHLLIQIPGILKHQFSWTPSLDIRDPAVQKVFRLVSPRVATVFLIQVTFLARDNLASHMPQGSVTALTYGYFILQVPETLIGTAIATALLPTLSDLASNKKRAEFAEQIKRALQVMIATTVVISLLLALTLPQFIDIVFDFSKRDSMILVWTTQAYLLGLLGHVVLEVIARAFYAKQNAMLPLKATALRTGMFLLLSTTVFNSLGVVGLAIADSLTVLLEVGVLLFFLYKQYPAILNISSTVIRTIAGSAASVCVLFVLALLPIPSVPRLFFALLVASGIYLLFIKKEIKLLVRL